MKRQTKLLLALALVLTLLAGMLPAALAEEIPAEAVGGGAITVEAGEIAGENAAVADEAAEEAPEEIALEADVQEPAAEANATAIVVESIASAFPDAALQKYVLENFDTDKDGKLSSKEIKNAKYLVHSIDDYPNDIIASLEGIEYLTELDVLVFGGMTLNDADRARVEGCKKLTVLALDNNDNHLGSLDLSGMKNLQSAFLSNAGLESLNVSDLKKLNTLFCDQNPLKSLDVSGLSSLVDLFCRDCAIEQLVLSGNASLKQLHCWGNALTSLDVSGCPNLIVLDPQGNPNLTSLTLERLNKLNILTLIGTQLEALDLSHCALYAKNAQALAASARPYEDEEGVHENFTQYRVPACTLVAEKFTAVDFGPENMAFNKKGKRTMYAGDLLQLVADAGIKTCKSSNKKVAAVTKGGLITAKKAGKAKITVTLNNKKKIVLTLTVKK